MPNMDTVQPEIRLVIHGNIDGGGDQIGFGSDARLCLGWLTQAKDEEKSKKERSNEQKDLEHWGFRNEP